MVVHSLNSEVFFPLQIHFGLSQSEVIATHELDHI